MNESDWLLVPPVRPMAARPAAALPDEQHAARLAFEPKFDGFVRHEVHASREVGDLSAASSQRCGEAGGSRAT